MRFEEIQISAIPSGSDGELRSEAKVVNATLEQCNRFRFCSFAFELFNQRLLRVKTEGVLQRSRDYELDIGILDPQPRRVVKISWRYLSAFLVLAASAALTACTDIL
jgi:hypothetical protein